jgi:hypothetical protein
METGYNTSAVAQRVVRGDGKETQCPRLDYTFPGGNKNGNLAQTWSIRNLRQYLARSNCGTRTRLGLSWRGIETVNYRPDLSSHNNKPATGSLFITPVYLQSVHNTMSKWEETERNGEEESSVALIHMEEAQGLEFFFNPIFICNL